MSVTRLRELWPVAVAIVVRVVIWSVLPDQRFASDEDSYYQVARTLLASGEQDLFWPPFTGWLIAFVATLLQTTDITWIRLAWVGLDIGCTVLVFRLAHAVARGIHDPSRARRFVVFVTLGYALYLPAVSFSQFATSEIPALLFVLGALVLLVHVHVTPWRAAAAGLMLGVLSVTRPSLLPLLLVLPVARVLIQRPLVIAPAVIAVVAGGLLVGGVIARNWWTSGVATIAQNSAYNLFIGNRDLYAEDLDLFHPVATPEQIEFRRQFFSGQLAYPTASPEEMQRQAIAWIVDHPLTFARRALGRLARVFAPKTDVLELLGGERSVGVFTPRAMAILAAANAQWTVVLFGGLIGLVALSRVQPQIGALLLAAVLGSLPLCLIAISKPRYAFTFEPILLIGAVYVLSARREAVAALSRRDWWLVGGCIGFLLWAWVAWVIFAFTSRTALTGAA
jgi:hypothetical protein